MKKVFSLLFTILTSSLMFATDFYDFSTLNVSPSAMSITNGSVSYNSSKGYYEVSNNANDTLSMTISGVPNVAFMFWAETSKKAFKIKPNDCIQLDGATRTLRISNLNINDIVTIWVASKGSSAANSFSGGLTNCTLYSGNLTQSNYSYPLVYERVSFQATASTIEITNTAGGYCLAEISIGQNQTPQHSGTCGPNLTWTLNNGVLTISGTGNMTNYSMMDPYAPSPWHSYSYDITRVIIDDGVTSIGNDAFSECRLTSVTIPNSVTNIGNYAFYFCTELASVIIPNSVTQIGEGTFLGCSSLASVTIPNSVTSIGESAFASCTGLISATIPNSVTSIGRNAFNDCRVLTSVTIPGSVISIGDHAFDHCSVLDTVYCESSTPPQLGEWAFDNTSSSFKIHVPCGALETYRTANEWQSYASKIHNPPSATIQTAPLVEGTGQVNAPQTICDSTLEAIPADGYRFVQWNDSCTDNPRIIDPEVEATYIAEFAKSDTCGGNLSWILRNDTLFISGSGPMTNWENDTLVPWHANHLTFNAVVINNGVSTIGDYAFSGDRNLTSVTLPETVITIGECAFFGCSNLTSLSIPQSVTSIGNAAFAVSGLSSVAIPGNISSIANSTFFYCSGLSSLVIGTNVETIETGAFSGCSNLQTIICYNSTPPAVENNALQGVPNTAIVYVPIESITIYQTHAVWGQFDVRPLNVTSLEDFPVGLAFNDILTNPKIKVFTLQGNDVTAQRDNLPSGTYIIRLGNKAGKVTIK